jgi:hypothetical protein
MKPVIRHRLAVGAVSSAAAVLASGVLLTTAHAATTLQIAAAPSDSACPSATSSGSPTATPSATSTATTSPSPGGLPVPLPIPLPIGSASATPTATTSATPTATTSSSPSCARLTLTVRPPDIVPNKASRATLHGTPNTAVELFAYSRPNTSYGKVRSGTTDPSGNIFWDLKPGTNTRLYAHYASGSSTTAPSDSPSTVITVHTSLSLSSYRDGVRKYHFQGTNLPRRAGQLITLYRYAKGPNLDQYCVPTAESDTTTKNDAGCTAVRTATARTNASNQWRIDRTFTGSGQFYFVVRTSTTLTNGRGHSNQRLTIIH